MTEELLLKLSGFAGLTILVVQAGNGIYKTYKKKYSQPDMIVYHFDGGQIDNDQTQRQKEPEKKHDSASLPQHVS